MTDRVARAWESVLSTENGRVVLAHLLAETTIFTTAHTPEEIAVEQHFKRLLGELGFYKDTGRFPLDFVKALSPYGQGESSE